VKLTKESQWFLMQEKANSCVYSEQRELKPKTTGAIEDHGAYGEKIMPW
jgi:hypothetical protein